MKTTIEIPDELAREAKDVAREGGTSLRDLVVTGLRSEVDRRRARDDRADFFFPVLRGGGGLQSGVRPSDLTRLAYEE